VSESRFIRWAAVVGDFGSPFFDEERQRDVWKEASAVGLQAMVWLTSVISAAALWIGGERALPYALAMVFTMTTGALVTVRYAGHRGVQPVSRRWLSARRLVLSWAGLLVFAGGLLRATWGHPSFRNGMAIGMVAGFVLAVVNGVRALREADRAALAEAEAPDVP